MQVIGTRLIADVNEIRKLEKRGPAELNPQSKAKCILIVLKYK